MTCKGGEEVISYAVYFDSENGVKSAVHYFKKNQRHSAKDQYFRKKRQEQDATRCDWFFVFYNGAN